MVSGYIGYRWALNHDNLHIPMTPVTTQVTANIRPHSTYNKKINKLYSFYNMLISERTSEASVTLTIRENTINNGDICLFMYCHV